MEDSNKLERDLFRNKERKKEYRLQERERRCTNHRIDRERQEQSRRNTIVNRY